MYTAYYPKPHDTRSDRPLRSKCEEAASAFELGMQKAMSKANQKYLEQHQSVTKKSNVRERFVTPGLILYLSTIFIVATSLQCVLRSVINIGSDRQVRPFVRSSAVQDTISSAYLDELREAYDHNLPLYPQECGKFNLQLNSTALIEMPYERYQLALQHDDGIDLYHLMTDNFLDKNAEWAAIEILTCGPAAGSLLEDKLNFRYQHWNRKLGFYREYLFEDASQTICQAIAFSRNDVAVIAVQKEVKWGQWKKQNIYRILDWFNHLRVDNQQFEIRERKDIR